MVGRVEKSSAAVTCHEILQTDPFALPQKQQQQSFSSTGPRRSLICCVYSPVPGGHYEKFVLWSKQNTWIITL